MVKPWDDLEMMQSLGPSRADRRLPCDCLTITAAVAFYRHHGFRPLASLPRTLFLPLATAEKVLLGGGS